MKQHTIIRIVPSRLMFIIFILAFMSDFTDSFAAAAFGVTLSFFTGRMFPMVEYVKYDVQRRNKQYEEEL